MPEIQEQEFKLSERTTVVLAPMSALDTMNADEIVGASKSEALANKVYAICAIKSLNGEAVNPQKSKGDFAYVAAKLDFGEMIKLGLVHGEFVASSMSDDLKNELTALSSATSQAS